LFTTEKWQDRLRFFGISLCDRLWQSFSNRFIWICIITITWLNLCIPESFADYKRDIGFATLQADFGSALPDGSTIPLVTQTEAATLIDHDGDEKTAKIKVWMPDPSHKEFSGKEILNRSGALPFFSKHATAVGSNFYGKNGSITPGIKNVESYLADHWLGPGFLRSDRLFKPHRSASRIANHSWVAATDKLDSAVLRRIDWVVATDEATQVVGSCRPGKPLLGSAFNTIAVGKASGENGKGSAAVDTIYSRGRTCLQLVAPRRTASAAAPVVASAATMLIELGHGNPGLSTDPVTQRTTNRNGDTIYNAERSEVIKAALMAGADRKAQYTTDTDGSTVYIADYRVKPEHQAANGLDRRYGAGQVNIDNSFRIIAGGEQNSNEDLSHSGGVIEQYGFDYDPDFGGGGSSNTSASYYFTVEKDSKLLWATLVWNVEIDAGVGPYFLGDATLYDLDLLIYDVTEAGEPRMVAGSTALAENSENLWLKLEKNHRYMLRVQPGTNQVAFKWDYALAWRIESQVE